MVGWGFFAHLRVPVLLLGIASATAAGSVSADTPAEAAACPVALLSPAPATLSPDAAAAPVEAVAGMASFASANALLGPAISGCGTDWRAVPGGLRFAYAATEAARGGGLALSLRPGGAHWDIEAAFRHDSASGAAAGGLSSRLSLWSGRLKLATDAALTPPGGGQRGGGALRQRIDLAGQGAGLSVAAHLAGAHAGAGFDAPGVDADRQSGEAGLRLAAGRASLALSRTAKRDNLDDSTLDARTRWRTHRAEGALALWRAQPALPDELTLALVDDSRRRREAQADRATHQRSLTGGLRWRGAGWEGGLGLAAIRDVADGSDGRAVGDRQDARLHGRLKLGSWVLGMEAAHALHAARDSAGAATGKREGRLALKADWRRAGGAAVAMTLDALRRDGDAAARGWRFSLALDPGAGLPVRGPLRARLAYVAEMDSAAARGSSHRLTAMLALGF